jgi:site-specific DNA-cytosine methylase
MADISMMGHEGTPRMYHDIAPTLTARTYKEPPVIMPSIRRLTPTECERLQGFPDGWTEGVSDTQRYKTLGNAVTVNVIEEIISKIT